MYIDVHIVTSSFHFAGYCGVHDNVVTREDNTRIEKQICVTLLAVLH